MHLGNVMIAMRRLVRGLTNLTWVTAGFGWITGIAPILVAAPLYFSGKTTFGGMMMAAAAFTQAQGSLRWFVDNFSAIADWRATLLRVANFRQALVATETQRDFESRIEYERRRARARWRSKICRSTRPSGARCSRSGTSSITRGRARADLRRAGRRQDAAVPRACGPLAMGQRAHRPAAGRSR